MLNDAIMDSLSKVKSNLDYDSVLNDNEFLFNSCGCSGSCGHSCTFAVFAGY